MLAGPIKVDFASLDALVDRLATRTDEIEKVLATLESDVRLLRGQWTGAASNAYDRAHAEWSIELAAMNDVMRKLAKAVSLANSDYRDTESRAAKAWA